MSPPISSSPDFDPSQLREVVAAHKDELLRCYTRIACPRQFAYTMNACFTIAASGAVELADSDSVNASLRACTAGVLGSLHFPKPAHPMEVTYRLTFNAK